MSQKTPSSLIHCDSCGEDYSATYRRCPFCGNKGGKPKAAVSHEDEYVFDGGYIFDEIDREASEKAPRNHQNSSTAPRSGKRISGGTASSDPKASAPSDRSHSIRTSSSEKIEKTAHSDVRTSGTRSRTAHSKLEMFDEFLERNNLTLGGLIGLIFSLIIIIAAFIILLKVIIPMFGNDSGNTPSGTNTGTSQTGNPTPSNSGASTTSTPDPSPSASPSASQIPADQTATDFELSLTEFAISDRWPQPITIKVKFIPANSKGTISWKSSNENIATVDQSGTVTAVSKGSATITATLAGGVSHTCKVYINISESATNSPSPDPSASVSPEPSQSPTTSPEPSQSPTTSPEPSQSPTVSPEPDPSTSPEPSQSPTASPEPSAKPLSLNKQEFTISDQWPQPVTLRVSNASGEVVWKTSDATVAIVDSSGKVTGIGKGRCTITVTDAAGNSAECIVRCTFS